jgi:hypothetical protein
MTLKYMVNAIFRSNDKKLRMIFDTHGALFTPEMRGNPEIPNDHTSFMTDILDIPIKHYYRELEEKKGNLVNSDAARIGSEEQQ